MVFFNGQIEVAPKTGRPHIQSFWILDKEATKKDHIKVAEKIFGLDDAGKSSTNITWPTKGTTEECLNYTSKPDLYDREWQDGDRVQGTDTFKYGEFELLEGWSPGEQGSRNDLSEIYETLKGDPFQSFDDLLDQYEGTSCFGSLVRYEKFFNQTKQRLIQTHLTNSLSTELGELQLHPWQQHLMTMLSKPPHARHVIVVLDVCGATGKSTLSALLRTGSMQFHSQGGGRREDLAYAFANFFRETPKCRGLALDLPKSLCTTSSDFRMACFTFAEQVKRSGGFFDGFFHSSNPY